MTPRFIALGLVIAALSSSHAAEHASEPFASVVRRGDVIIATLPATGLRFVITDSPKPRVTSYGESFELRDGASLSLHEKHSSYRITCHLVPPPAGLQVESKFDARSFGGTMSEKSYFIKAQ
ncbi:MAG TPA: hypothetical protein VIW07_13340 [Candidatus Udaeobacter sp.]|jgi:hypothetical protein